MIHLSYSLILEQYVEQHFQLQLVHNTITKATFSGSDVNRRTVISILILKYQILIWSPLRLA